ncbi:MAG: ABC transporter permease [Nanoarchaeota archaeon]|jgi:ABC-type multidrug transport system permease subunit|nr:ABC transporter permease [Nanoarchaeota archaeon]
MKAITKFYGYIKKDTLLLVRRKKYLYLSIALPLIIAFLFLLILNPSQYELKVGVCDFDNTEQTRMAFTNMNGFEAVFLDQENCIDNLKEAVKKQKYPLGISIGKGFTAALENLTQSHITIYYDNTDLAFANLMAWKIDQSLEPFEREIVDKMNVEIQDQISELRNGIDTIKEIPESKYIQKRIDKIDNSVKKIENIKTEFLVNPLWTYHQPIYTETTAKDVGITFVLPIIALFILLMLSSTSIIYDKKTNFLTRVKSSSNPINYILAKVTFFIGLTIAQFVLITLLFLIYGASLNISIPGVINLILFIGITNTLLGLLIGLISDNEGIAILFSLIISFPLMLLSGIFTPLQTMPAFTQTLAKILPLSHQITSAKLALLFGQNIPNIWIYPSIAMLIGVYYLIRKQ